MMIETYIMHKLENVAEHVYAEKPEQPDGEYLVVDVLDESKKNQIKSCTVSIRAYADSFARAAELNDAVKEYMSELWKEPDVSSCKISTSSAVNSTAMMQYRYQSIWDIVHYL